MGYRLNAWDGHHSTRDQMRGSGKLYATYARKSDANKALAEFMRTHSPRSPDARIILEKHSGQWGSTTLKRFESSGGYDGKWVER